MRLMNLLDILSYEFVQRAMVAGMLIAAVSALLGLFLVLRRFSLIGDGLAHYDLRQCCGCAFNRYPALFMSRWRRCRW